MKRALILACLVAMLAMCASAGTITSTFFMSPTQTFLFQATTGTSSPDTDSRALFLQLTCPVSGPSPQADGCINAPTGSTLLLTAVGQQCAFSPLATCTEGPAALAGIFDMTNTEAASASLGAGNVNRLGVGNTVNAGVASIVNTAHLNTWSTNVDTTIPNDFYIPTAAGVVGNIATPGTSGITVIVPVGANFLVIGDLDSLFKDNSDRSGTFGIQISVTTPSSTEPATFALFGAGLAGLGLLRRRTR